MNGRENIIEALEFLKGYGIMRKEENLISTRIGRRFSSFGADIARPAACGFSPPCPDETGHDSAKVSGRFSKKGWGLPNLRSGAREIKGFERRSCAHGNAVRGIET